MPEAPVLYWVQSNLGAGHVVRAQRIASAMISEGMDVTIASGGRYIERLEASEATILPLPKIVSAVDDIRRLEDERGCPVSDQLWRSRSRVLADAVERIHPRVIVTETFPFGRTAFRRELMPILQSARRMRSRPRLVASVRDILVSKRNSSRNDEMLAIAREHYDRVIVHGDPNLIAFDSTFPRAAELADRISYSGYVVERVETSPPNRRKGIVVSAGGGAVGEKLVRTALMVANETTDERESWHIVTGVGGLETIRHAKSKHHITITGHLEKLGQRIARSKISVSQAGYNTVAESLLVGTPMVLIPYEPSGEDEQLRRADCVAQRGHAIVVREAELTPRTLRDAINKAKFLPIRMCSIDVNGAESTATIVRELLNTGNAEIS